MPRGFTNIEYHAADQGSRERTGLEGIADQFVAPGDLAARQGLAGLEFTTDEAAARFYLSQLLSQSHHESLNALAPADQPQAVPDLRLRAVREQPLTATRIVFFDQTTSSIPIFGSNVYIELDAERHLVASDLDVAPPQPDVSPIATLSPGQGLERIAQFAGVDVESLGRVRAPETALFYDTKTEEWRLAYLFSCVPAVPPGFVEQVTGEASGHEYHGHGVSDDVRLTFVEMEYLVDAHDGTILLYYSSHPMLDIPIKLRGCDEEAIEREFFGGQIPGGFALSDPLRGIKTYDLGLKDWTHTELPATPAANTSGNWGSVNPAAISAHVNAVRVYSFFKTEMMRDGIDDKGMGVVSVVNCTYPAKSHPPAWRNAVWHKDRMWYGQVRDAQGKLRSLARYLDVIAHELTHGVTEYTSKLVYLDQSGALNESFSDIFGVIIKNWYGVGPEADTSQWNWELGPGLGKESGPLRDLSDPTRTGDPDNMKDYWDTPLDNGGVHTNSNIHNKAAYNVLTAVDAENQPIFSAREAAILYYLTLTRLGKLADFAKARQVLIQVVKTFYAGDPDEMTRKVQAIKAAYNAVGITC